MCRPMYSMEVSRTDEAPRPESSGYPRRRLKTIQWIVFHGNIWEESVPKFLSTSRKSQIRLTLADFPMLPA